MPSTPNVFGYIHVNTDTQDLEKPHRLHRIPKPEGDWYHLQLLLSLCRTETIPTSNTTASIAQLLNLYREDVPRLATDHGAPDACLFGSVVSGQAAANSANDVLVDFESGRSLLDRIAPIQDLEDLPGIKGDVVTGRSVHRDMMADILRSTQAF